MKRILAIAGLVASAGIFVGTASAAPPVNQSEPTISGTARQGQTLTASNGTWNNSPTSFAYQWRRCDTAGANCSNISGATSRTYTLTSADVGDRVRVRVTATNADGSASALSNATPVVASADGP